MNLRTARCPTRVLFNSERSLKSLLESVESSESLVGLPQTIFHKYLTVGHFTVVCLVTWSMTASEAKGDLALIQTSLLLSCKCT